MMVDPERIINRLLIGSIITTATWTLATGDFDTVFGVLTWFAITLFVQEDIYDFVRKKRKQARRKKRAMRKSRREAEKYDYRERMGA